VGINYAIQDAVASANILTAYLQRGQAPTSALARVQRRRELPTKLIQAFQRLLQKQILQQILTARPSPKPPLPLRLVLHTPLLRELPPRFIAFGPRRERVENP
jgi:2-polyprenyl-6-methoxyphenol hydroxylase-like FAD-dependent oxidoreductase